MATLKFSQFTNGGLLQVGSQVVGLSAGSSPTNTIFDFPGTGIQDSNGSNLVGWVQPASGTAVNYLELSNALTTESPKLAALGLDASVNVEIESKGADGIVIINAGALLPASGTTAERPTTGIAGMLRYNTTTSSLEYYTGAVWDNVATASGTVLSVSGTANRITSTGGTTPVIDISPLYAGQASITTLGTITGGIWQGTVVGSAYGGTGVNNAGRTLTISGGNLSLTAGAAGSESLTNLEIQGYRESFVFLGSVSGAVDLDLSLGTVFRVVATGAITFEAINVPTGVVCSSISVYILNGGASGVTWMPGTIWPGGTIPTLSVSGLDVLVFSTITAGVSWCGNVAGLDYQ